MKTAIVTMLATAQCAIASALSCAADGVFVRFRLHEPAGATYYVELGGYIHLPNWYLPPAAIPADGAKDASARVKAGEFTEWFDLAALGEDELVLLEA